MKLIGLMPMRNEDWCLGLTLRAALEWCDEVIVRLHGSSDLSHDIVVDLQKQFGKRLWLILDKNNDWDEMRHRQSLLEWARRHQATHIAIIDADEILTGNLLPKIRSVIEELAPNTILQLPLFNLRGSISRYHSNGIWGNRIVSLAFPDDKYLHWSGDTFHQREPHGLHLECFRPLLEAEGGVMHLWGVSERRLKAKHALYKITERIRWPAKGIAEIDTYYNHAIGRNPGFAPDRRRIAALIGKPELDVTDAETWNFADVPPDWWAPYSQWLGFLKPEAEPWQEAECRRLVAEHGRAMVEGLDLFGVV